MAVDEERPRTVKVADRGAFFILKISPPEA
ncbi:hypothetical protein POI8812_02035 [Pontivivens insulae]|uniref:Uncharacterized protein n=1 Tax=Pontivivens insulae TaxID=1639689 RepID=A0A2R8ABU5_9RHOB|nr:hypothetical protein DFR53_3136 [Pontivivens insulae]SPF29719.1 hypothetical protein POI8812_02035 [Pontivivens insulae]